MTTSNKKPTKSSTKPRESLTVLAPSPVNDSEGGVGELKDVNISQEYQDLLDAVRGHGRFARADTAHGALGALDPYQHLLSREQRVLDTVDRVVNDALHESDQGVTKMPLHKIAMRTVAVVRAVIDDLIEVRRPEEVMRVLFSDHERVLYLGVAVLAIALFVIVVDLL